jgi:hypothetical protein
MCQQKEGLLLTYTDALNTLLGHLRLQADAISSGDPDYGRYDATIEAAERHKKEAAHTYSAHAVHHGCSVPLYLEIDSARGRMNRDRNLREEYWMPCACGVAGNQYATISAGS